MRYCPRSWDMGKHIVIAGCWKLAAPIPKQVMLGVGGVCQNWRTPKMVVFLLVSLQTNRRAPRPIPPRGAAGSGDAAGRGGAEVVKVWPVDASANKANEGDAQKKLLLKTQFRHVRLHFDHEFLLQEWLAWFCPRTSKCWATFLLSTANQVVRPRVMGSPIG